ncbi:unnamed protein product [Thelazia callipaeda]|uniref:Ovule protein n=1 Tax=Thelazia callipaeda TaxID=103827 RepID=A0A0N5DB15_THECL|nr:unnamed protein product [Thelazia callipaeda]
MLSNLLCIIIHHLLNKEQEEMIVKPSLKASHVGDGGWGQGMTRSQPLPFHSSRNCRHKLEEHELKLQMLSFKQSSASYTFAKKH